MRAISVVSLSFLGLVLIGSGCAGPKKATVSPYAGVWSFTVDAAGDLYTGTITITDEGGDLAGSIYSDRDRATLPMENVTFEAPSLGFQILHPMYGRLTGQTTIEGEVLRGSLSVPGEGSFQIRGRRTPEAS